MEERRYSAYRPQGFLCVLKGLIEPVDGKRGDDESLLNPKTRSTAMSIRDIDRSSDTRRTMPHHTSNAATINLNLYPATETVSVLLSVRLYQQAATNIKRAMKSEKPSIASGK